MKRFLFLVIVMGMMHCEGLFQEGIKNDASYQHAKWKFVVHQVQDLRPIDYEISEMPEAWQTLQKESSEDESGRDALTCLVANLLDEKEIIYWVHGISLLFPKTDTTYLVLHPFSEEAVFSFVPVLASEYGVTLEGTVYGVKMTKGQADLHLLFSRYLSAGLDQLHILHPSGHGDGQEKVRRPFGVEQTAPLFYYESEIFPRTKHQLKHCAVFFPRSYKEILKWTLDSWSLDEKIFEPYEKVPHEKKGSSYLYKRATQKHDP